MIPINSAKIKTIFVGTPDFGLKAFEAIVKDERFKIIAAITQPDKPAGRKGVITPTPIKKAALALGLPVYQPKKISDFNMPFNDVDLIVTAAYGQIIPEKILNFPKYGCVNIHGSLLPRYRGASCVQAAILNGDKKTGITIIKMDKGLDTGDIIAREEIKISAGETYGSLYAELSALAGRIIVPILLDYISGKTKPVPQDNAESSYAGIIKKSGGHIDFKKSAGETEKFVRAMNPWPGAFAFTKNKKMLKLLNVKKIIFQNGFKPGQFFQDKDGLAVQCGQNSLLIGKLQIEGKKEMSAEEFLKGNKKLIGETLK